MKKDKKQRALSPGTAPKSNALQDGTAVLVLITRTSARSQ
jgi:hypothetical protein